MILTTVLALIVFGAYGLLFDCTGEVLSRMCAPILPVTSGPRVVSLAAVVTVAPAANGLLAG